MHGTFATRKNIHKPATVSSRVTNASPRRHERMRGMNDAASHPLPPGQLAGLRVLVVEDRPEDRMLLVDFLTSQDCRVYVAEDGNDGYRKAQLVQPDIILMDVNMPVCDGLAACRLLKADQATRGIPIIFLTAPDQPGAPGCRDRRTACPPARPHRPRSRPRRAGFPRTACRPR